MPVRSKINRFVHKLYVKGVGSLGDHAISKIIGLPSFGVIGKSVDKYDRNVAHQIAIRKSYRRMKRTHHLTPAQFSDAYYKDRTSVLNRHGLLHGGIFTQYFKKKK